MHNTHTHNYIYIYIYIYIYYTPILKKGLVKIMQKEA